MAVHPMSTQLRVDHIHLVHRLRLKGTWYLDPSIEKVVKIIAW
jgi:hypothetical protein